MKPAAAPLVAAEPDGGRTAPFDDHHIGPVGEFPAGRRVVAGQCGPAVQPYLQAGQGTEVVEEPGEELQVVARDPDPQRSRPAGDGGRHGRKGPVEVGTPALRRAPQRVPAGGLTAPVGRQQPGLGLAHGTGDGVDRVREFGASGHEERVVLAEQCFVGGRAVEDDGQRERAELQDLGGQFETGVEGGVAPAQAQVAVGGDAHGLLTRLPAVVRDAGSAAVQGPCHGRPEVRTGGVVVDLVADGVQFGLDARSASSAGSRVMGRVFQWGANLPV